MRKKGRGWLLILGLIFSLMGCSSGEAVSDYVAKPEDEYVLILDNVRCKSDTELAGALQIGVADDATSIYTVDGKDASKISVTVDEKKKTIKVKAKGKVSPDSVRIHITANVKTIEANDCKLNVDVDFGNVKNVNMTLNGTFFGDMRMETQNIQADINGSGKLRLSGKSESMNLHLQGAAYIDADDLISEKVDVLVKGTSICEVYASDSLNAELLGIGNITYFGNPQHVNKTVKGLGRIVAK